MAAQTSYSLATSAALAGQVADINPATIVTKVVETAAGIGFGLVVSRGTANNQCTLGGDGTGIGVTVRDLAGEGAALTGAITYAQYDNAGIMVEGYCYAPIYSAAASKGAKLRYNDTTGRIDAEAIAAGHTAMNAHLEEAVTSSGQVALIRLDSPMVQGEYDNVQTVAIAANAAAITALGTPFDYKGNIAAAADFPTAAAVEQGWFYTVSADVTDNDATKTNTGLVFRAGNEIVWSGATWVLIGQAEIASYSNQQAVAASATLLGFVATRTGRITALKAVPGAAAAAGESLTVDVQINGVTALSAVATINAASALTVVSGTIDAAANALAADDIVTIVLTYVAGGGPTPIINTLFTVEYEQ